MKLISKLFGTRKSSQLPADQVRISGNWVALTGAVPLVHQCHSTDELIEYIRHYSGYLREAAIGRAIELPRAEFLAPVADRLNDWVPEVRRAARSAVLSFLAVLPAKDFLAVLPRLFALRGAKREDHTDWLERFEQVFLGKADLDLLKTAIQGAAHLVSRACYSLALRHTAIDLEELVDLGLRSKDVVLAVQAAHLCETLDESKRRSKLHEAVRSPFGTVRTTALRSLLKLGSTESQKAVALRFLWDSQGAARDIAMQWLKDVGVDVRLQYLEALQEAQASLESVRASLLALSRCGTSADVEVVKRFTTSSSPAVRAAAFLCWVKLDHESKDVIAAKLLEDESPRVRKLAVFFTQRLAAYVPFERVMALADSGRGDRLALSLSMSDKWHWLECIVRIGSKHKDDAEFKGPLGGHLERWLRNEGKSYSVPTAQQAAMLFEKENVDVLQALCGRKWPELQMRLRMQLSS